MVFTRTITLAGAELSSFLAAGGQTVNPDAATPAVAAAVTPAVAATTNAAAQVPFPTLVPTTPTAAAAVATTPIPQAAIVVPTTTPAAAAVVTPRPTAPLVPATTATPSTAAPATTAPLSSRASAAAGSGRPSFTRMTSSSSSTGGVKVTSSAVRASASASRSVGSAASTSQRSTGSGLSSGGIAGLVIGLLLLLAIVAGFLLLQRKRKRDKADRERAGRRNEKGMVRLEEEEIISPREDKSGFDFGHLPTILPGSQLNQHANNFRSASPADMDRGAAVLGIQRPFTPPPGHPAHPAYQQPPALVAGRQMQQRPVGPPPGQMRSATPTGLLPSQTPQVRNLTPDPMQMPRRPVPAAAAPAPVVQRQLSSNNPFNDPAESGVLAAPLAHSSSPVVAAPAASHSPVPARRPSVESFVIGDDSFEAETLAAVTTAPVEQDIPVTAPLQVGSISPRTPAMENERPASPASGVSQPGRSKSVMVATDNWAARKAQLKNNLALSSKPTSPAPEQSPFADPAPLLDHQIAALSPMNLEFDAVHKD